MEPATAHDRRTTHAPARTLDRPAPADNHKPIGLMDATNAGTTEPRQARVSRGNPPNRRGSAHSPDRENLARPKTHIDRNNFPGSTASPNECQSRMPMVPAVQPLKESFGRFNFGTKGMARGGRSSAPGKSQFFGEHPLTQRMPTPHANGTRRSTPQRVVRTLQLSARRVGTQREIEHARYPTSKPTKFPSRSRRPVVGGGGRWAAVGGQEANQSPAMLGP